jgi:Family of unknown function (DUF6308)
MTHFTTHPIEYFSGRRRSEAIGAMNDYRRKTGFHFDLLARETDPFTITPQDIVAVSMLSVDVPASVSVWLLGEGAETVSDLLRVIEPPQAKIWDDEAELQRNSPAWNLWNAVDGRRGMGPTKTSKLLAAKRPHLLPVIDDVVRDALFSGQPRSDVEYNYWDLWRDELRGSDGAELRGAVEAVRDEAGYDSATSVLRVIDIVVWSLNREK